MDKSFSSYSLKLNKVIIILTIVLMALIPNQAFADRSLSMRSLYIDAQLLPDASMRVTEKITVEFNEQWNGFCVKIPEGTTPIVDVSVSESDQPYTYNPSTEYGPPGTFLTKKEGSDILIDWSIDAYDQTKTFELSYTVVNAVKIHNDVAELYRKFVGDANGNEIGDVQVNLSLPSGAESYIQGQDIRIWGHGPLDGVVEFTQNNGVTWKTSNLSPYTFVEGRVVMPTALFSDVPREAYTNQMALGSILSEEQANADKANKERQRARFELGGAAGILAATIGALIYLWGRFGRKYRSNFEGDYYRDLPADYSPAELSILWNYKKMKPDDITATILDLARRKFLYLEEDKVEVKKLIGTKEVTTYKLTFMPDPEPGSFKNPEDAVLKRHEQKLLDYLKNDIGGRQPFIHLTEIEDYAKKYGEEFYKFWQSWTEDIEIATAKYSFFDENKALYKYSAIGGILLIALGIFTIFKMLAIGIALVVSGLMILLVPQLFRRRSPNGQDDYVKWKAFKKFLEHFSEMQKHEIPSLIIWEHYLVYAVTLGVAKEVIKQLELVFPNMTDGDYRFGYGWMNYSSYGSFRAFNDSFDMVGNSIDKAFSSAQKAVSKSSSGGGSGGGFSGGGGGGGGGGSYGGR